jgi:hypothetical protein
LAKSKLSSVGQRSPTALISRALKAGCPWDVAVVKGVLAGLQVSGDEQGVSPGGGGEPGLGVLPLALRAAACRADLPLSAEQELVEALGVD